MSTIILKKLAWIRDPSVPQGQRAPGRFECPCGNVIEGVEYASTSLYTCDGCGAIYDACGWVQPAPDPATLYLERMGMSPRAYKPRCVFGQQHTWIRPPGASEDQDVCSRCGVVGSQHPLSLAVTR